MPTPAPTVDELVQTLKHSSLPTVVVEGTSDATVYRWIEQRLGPLAANTLPCNGRTNLLAVYKRRAEFSGLRTAFLADRDMWLFSAIPDGYEDIVWTAGYCIENDVYDGADLEALLEPAEWKRHGKYLDSIATWFAFEVEEFLAGRVFKVDCRISELCSTGSTSLNQNFVKRRGFKAPDGKRYSEIRNNYRLKVRGKQLFELLLSILNEPRRRTSYGRAQLFEIACKLTTSHPHLEAIARSVSVALNGPSGQQASSASP